MFFSCDEADSGICFDPCMWKNPMLENDCSYYPVDFSEDVSDEKIDELVDENDD